ncbi:LuxR C-terminal-related transcriptional regulator [Kribbella sp. NPDC048915]|uniref:LuxR C-terminal-related transcriptional regulator n=1 Tax=Kribbella sp. NPDC048915 TaxID=3155148 RepID=UPI003409EFE0
MSPAEAEHFRLGATEALDVHLLTTKLARPRVPSTYVERPRIAELLQQGSQQALTVVSAGAGWGKTLATAAWAASARASGPVAWLSLDESDNHPRSFWTYFVAAIRSAVDIPRDNPLAGLAPGLGGGAGSHRRMVEGLSRLPEPVIVVLDDFQGIREPAVLARIAELLRHPPAPLRLMLLTRVDPALPLRRLELRGELTELRSRDLAFDLPAALALFAAHGLAISSDDARLLLARTEGWPAGLRLAVYFLKGGGRTAADFAGDDQAVSDYLLEEVLTSQPPELQRFLLRTSVADRVSGGLAHALTGDPRGERFLERLERSNAFVIGLHPDRRWYRYHPMLREMLRHQLALAEPEIVPDLERRAALWYATNGQPIEALRHSADAADWHLLGRLFVRQAAPLMVSAQRSAVAAQLTRVPSGRLTETPELAVCAAALRMHSGRFREMRPHLERARAQLDRAGPEERVATSIAIRVFSAAVSRTHGDIDTLIAESATALDETSGPGALLPAAEPYRAIALSNLGTGLLWYAAFDEADERLQEGLQLTTAHRLDASRINVLAHLGLAAAVSGWLRRAFEYAAEAVEVVEARGWEPLPQAANAHLALSIVQLRWNNLDEAQSHLVRSADAARPEPAARCAAGLGKARLHAFLGRSEAARRELARVHRELARWRPPILLRRWQAITEAELDLTADDPAAAIARLSAPASHHQPPFEREQTCLAEAHLASGDAQRAEEILASLPAEADDPTSAVEAWLLTALAADQLGRTDRVLDALGRAVEAARRTGVRRTLLFAPMHQPARLLIRAANWGPDASAVLGELLGGPRQTGPSAPVTPAAEPLTERELTVLNYLPTMMTNAEIAAELFVSVNTVKAHLKRIFQKLDVTTRRDAVRRARELGLLNR